MERRITSEGSLRRMLSANSVLPEQFFRAPHGNIYASGERYLMWAVFADGVESYRRNACARTPQGKLLFLEAENWIFSTDWDWPFSFVNLCQIFGFNPHSVRQALWRWRGSHRGVPLRRQRFRPIRLLA